MEKPPSTKHNPHVWGVCQRPFSCLHHQGAGPCPERAGAVDVCRPPFYAFSTAISSSSPVGPAIFSVIIKSGLISELGKLLISGLCLLTVGTIERKATVFCVGFNN